MSHKIFQHRFTHRLALLDDLAALHQVMARSIEHLQSEFLSPEQISVSHKVMGLDTQLVKDGTYFVVEHGTGSNLRIAGCGGWSFRSTLYGGDASIIEREPERLEPTRDAARIRAMYTDPDFVRCGVGRLVMDLGEAAAWDAGFRRTEMMATLAGMPLYHSCGYLLLEEVLSASVDGVRVPLMRMGKVLTTRPSFG